MRIFHPASQYLFRWNLFLTIIMTYCLFAIPFKLVFASHDHGFYVPIIDAFITLCLFVDIFINFHTTYIEKGLLVKDRHLIRKHYLKTSFIRDLLVAIPFDLIFCDFLLSDALSYWSLIRMLFVFKCLQFFSNLSRSQNLNLSVTRMIGIGYLVSLYMHWIACLWFTLGDIGYHQGSGWLVKNGIEQASVTTQYIKSLYWVVTTMATVGYGDITPVTDLETIGATIVMLIGASIYAYTIGNLASMLANLDAAKAAFNQKIQDLEHFLKVHHVPQRIKQRIFQYLEYIKQQNRFQSLEQSPLEGLPENFRIEIALFLHEKTIRKVKLFEGSPPGVISAVAKNLKEEIYLPGEYIFKAGEMGSCMYFISKGEIEILGNNDKTVFCTMQSGGFFGELALLKDAPRAASARTKTHVEVYSLHREDLERLFKIFPDLAEKIRLEAEKHGK